MLCRFKAAHGNSHKYNQADRKGDCFCWLPICHSVLAIFSKVFHFQHFFEPPTLCARGWASNHTAIRYWWMFKCFANAFVSFFFKTSFWWTMPLAYTESPPSPQYSLNRSCSPHILLFDSWCKPYRKCQISKTIEVQKVHNISKKSLKLRD